MGDVIPLEKPLQGRCGHCNKRLTVQSKKNLPAFCSYDCAKYGQPDKRG